MRMSNKVLTRFLVGFRRVLDSLIDVFHPRYETRSDYRRREQEQVRGRRAHAQEAEQRSESGRLQRQRDRDLRPDKRQQGGDPGVSEVSMMVTEYHHDS